VKSVTAEHTSTDHTGGRDLSGWGFWCSPLTLAGPVSPSELLLGQWIKTCLQQTVWMEQQMAFCGRKVMEKTVLVAMRELTVTDSS